MELRTRKYFNPYYVKRDFGKKDIFQEYINQKWGLSSYLDNQRLTYASRPKWTDNKKTHEELTLKGAIYSEDFFAGVDLLEENMKTYSPLKIGIQDGIISRESTRNEYKLERALNEIIEKQSYGNRIRYPIPIRTPRWVELRKTKNTRRRTMTAIESELLDLLMKKEQEKEKEREQLHNLLSGIFEQNQQIINLMERLLSSGSKTEDLEMILNRLFEKFLVSLEESNRNLLNGIKQ